MKIFPKKRVRVTEGLYVNISNHFYYTDFGIRDMGEMRYTGRRYVHDKTPGTGFLERESESHGYHVFVRKCLAEQKPNYWRMIRGKEPSFDRELKAVTLALQQHPEGLKREILECYQNALSVARNEERTERLVRGIKDKMGHKSNKFMVSVMSHHKSRIRQMEADMNSVLWHVKDHCSEATYEAYNKMVEAFTRVASCRRVWYYGGGRRDSFVQVYFDLGVFDYIRSECFLPLLRTPQGVNYYILPTAVIAARSSTDFDVVPLKTLTLVSQELAIEEPSEATLSRMGDAASMIKIPEFNLNYYFNHLRPVVEFVHAVDRLKETL